MDALDHLAEPAAALLDRVDNVLSCTGAPAGHPVWVPLHRLGVLPGAAVDAVAALRCAPLAAPVEVLQELARRYADTASALPAAGSAWDGPAADAYARHAAALAGHLAGGPESLANRLSATAAYAEALVDWVSATRQAVAGTLAEVLVTREAVTLTAAAPGSPDAPAELALAAADIGVRVLETVAQAYDRADTLLDEHAGVVAVAAYRAADPTGGLGGTLRLGG